MSITRSEHYRETLQKELQRRRGRNPRYSVRAFARGLSLSPGALSQILSGKRLPSLALATRISRLLSLSPDQASRFLHSVGEAHRQHSGKRLPLAFRTPSDRLFIAPKELPLEMFRIISDWHHYAILELTFLPSFRPRAAWMARKLGVRAAEIRAAIDRLLRVGLLEERDGTLFKREATITTADKHLTTPALRRHQVQVLAKARESLENDPFETRSLSSMMMAIDSTRLPEARRRIDQFTHELREFLESDRPDRVYALGIQLFPLDRTDSCAVGLSTSDLSKGKKK